MTIERRRALSFRRARRLRCTPRPTMEARSKAREEAVRRAPRSRHHFTASRP
ncbi:hypothetical protein HMPREF0185_01448 [Brevundimonas diminuta 470-4]|nr:hypothetical protein HMPREF0185_01448 [Brevundimonas diminuta 470-4]